jgi:hypothetical protein
MFGFVSNSNNLLLAEENINFPFVTLNTQNGNVISHFDNIIVNNPLSAEAASIFNDNIVYSFSSTYYLFGRVNTANYYVMIFDFNKSISNTENIRRGDIIGEGSERKLIIFSETMDPFLVVNCISMPRYYGGFYWFDAMFLLPTGSTNWFSFEQTQNIENILNEILLIHQGFSFFPTFRYSFMGKLSEYPREITDNERQDISAFENMYFNRNIITHVNEIQIGRHKILLCWQSGFDQHLRNQYTLNNDIWFYSMNIVYNAIENIGYIFLRDFKLETLEEMYENRINVMNPRR